LIYLAKEAGADAAKFQHFQAKTIVSNYGFQRLGSQQSHQASWKKSVFEVYQDASVDLNWTAELRAACEEVGITFFTTPYALDVVDFMDEYVPAYKIGSGDITWHDLIKKVASKGKPYIIASGASTADDVNEAIKVGLRLNRNVCLMQCNTNYTASLDNFRYVQLNVLKTYRAMYPDMILGLSDHTPGHSTVLGAVTLGAKMIEKHFTDDTNRAGPDHKFSMDSITWREMIERTRELELALGNGIKEVEVNEFETVVLQRRSLRAVSSMKKGHIITPDDFIALRPCPSDAIEPFNMPKVLNKTLRRDLSAEDYLRWTDIE